jgi:capsular exopolysaccharide synthesis family protein
MAQETLYAGMFRSLKHNKFSTLFIIGLSLVGTFFFHRSFPTLYEQKALLRVLTTEISSEKSLAASVNGILSQRQVVEELLKDAGYEDTIILPTDYYTAEDAGSGLVQLVIRHPQPANLSPLMDTVIKALSEKFLGFSSEADRFEQEALERKQTVIAEKIKDTRDECSAANDAALPTPNLNVGLLEEGIKAQEMKVDELKQKLSLLPRVQVTASQEKSPEYQEIRSKLSRTRSALSELLLTYREKHPKVMKVNTEIRDLESRLRQVSSRKDRREANPEYEALLREVAVAETELTDLTAKMDMQKRDPEPTEPLQVANARVNEHRLKALENLYNDVVVKLEELNLKRATALGRIQVLRKDQNQSKPLGLSLAQRQVIGLLSGTILAVILLYTPLPKQNFMEGMGIPNSTLMGYGAPYENDMETMKRLMRVPLLGQTRMSGFSTPALPAPHDERLIVLNEPQSRLLDPYRSLVDNLQIQLSETGTRVLMVSSSRTGMGRTTLISNLAILLAQTNYSVVLVDANLRKPVLHRVFETENRLGLTHLETGSDEADLVQPTFVRNLSLVTSGPAPANPCEFLSNPAFRKLLDTLKRQFELVLIDTPALLDYPDARIIAGSTGGVVYLNREGEPDTDSRASRDFLKSLKCRVLGFVQS